MVGIGRLGQLERRLRWARPTPGRLDRRRRWARLRCLLVAAAADEGTGADAAGVLHHLTLATDEELVVQRDEEGDASLANVPPAAAVVAGRHQASQLLPTALRRFFSRFGVTHAAAHQCTAGKKSN